MVLENYVNAGKIASMVRENARKKNHIGRTLFEICESIENEIISLGGSPAFPVNVSLNEIAAHYTAEPNDQIIVKDVDVLKIDIGVQIHGYIADTAVTVCYNPKYEIIENTVSKQGFKPIQNLSGHSLEQFTIHAGKSIPNIWTIGSFSLISSQAYAIEPFVTTRDGQGIVYEGNI